jgi:hypothetical protein
MSVEACEYSWHLQGCSFSSYRRFAWHLHHRSSHHFFSEISDLSAGESASVVLSVTWNGYVSFNKPPEQIIVDVFSVPDGSRLGSFPLSKEDPCTSENTCMYRRSVQADYFPSGTYMLIASDPLSDATSRRMISLPPHNKGNSEFFTHFAQEQVFLLSSAILGTSLGVILAFQTGQKN